MSVNVIFPSEPTTLENVNEEVRRTINTTLSLPYSKQDLYFYKDIMTHHSFNKYIDKVYNNLEYLNGFSTIYNSVLPLNSQTCMEYTQTGKVGIFITNKYELTFHETEVVIFKGGVLYLTITETNFGKFRNIKDVIIIDDFILILDGNHILKINIANDPFEFITFFGGYGGSSSEFKFQNPEKIIYDIPNENIYIWDKGNSKIKIYNKAFIHNNTITISSTALDVNVYDNVVYVLETDKVTFDNTFINHDVANPSKLEIDNTQKGFLWVCGSELIKKYTIKGLNTGDYTNFINIKDLVRIGNKLHILVGDVWWVNLDYAFTQTIKKDFNFHNPISGIYVNPNEYINDWVINDIMFKVFDNLDGLNTSLTGKFVAGRNAQSSITQVNIDSSPTSSLTANCDYFIAHDEVVACNVYNRVSDELYDMFIQTSDKLLGLNTFLNDDTLSTNNPNIDLTPINWSIEAQSCDGIKPQLFNPNFTPITFAELQTPTLSCNPLTGGCLSAE